MEFIIMPSLREPYPEFLEQYNTAKSMAESAVANGENVIVFGVRGANGKTHLWNELDIANKPQYTTHYDTESIGGCQNLWIETIQQTDISYLEDLFKRGDSPYRVIEMPLSLLD